MSTVQTTITTAEYRTMSPFHPVGKLGGEKVYHAQHNPGNDTILITETERAHHAAIVKDQDAQIEAFKRQVLGLPEPTPIDPAELDLIEETVNGNPDITIGELADVIEAAKPEEVEE